MSLQEALAELKIVATQLNEVSNQLNETIRDFEDELVNTGIGLEVWLEAPIAKLPSYLYDERQYFLGFVKLDSKWQLAVRTSPAGRLSSVRLLIFTREIRIAACPYFEELTRLLIAKGREHLGESS